MARAIVLDGTGELNPAKLEIPSAFQHSFSLHTDEQYARNELDVAIRIAMGDHGFGSYQFREHGKLIVLAVGDEESKTASTEHLKAIISPILDQWGEVVAPIYVSAPQKQG